MALVRTRSFANIFYYLFDVASFPLGILGAFYLKFWMAGDPVLYRQEESLDAVFFHLTLWGVEAPFVLLIPAVVFPISGTYRKLLSTSTMDAILPVTQGAAVAVTLFAGLIYVNRGNESVNIFPASVLLASVGTTWALCVGWRLIVRFLMRVHEKSLHTKINLLIVGLSGLDEDTFYRLTQNDFPNYNIVGYLEGEERESFEFQGGPKKLGPLREITRILDHEVVNEILIVPAALEYQEFLKVIQICEAKNSEYRILPSYFDMVASRAQIDLVNYVPLLTFGQPHIEGWNAFFKRLIDFMLSLILIITFIPVFILVGLLIKIGSPGPVFFRQDRVGRYGKLFKVYKFRTMRPGSEKGAPLTAENDPRITRIGKFLRDYSLDELPQIFNVLKGEMSLVGPRAVVPFVADKFNDLEKMTLNVLPGITGLAQVSGRDAVSFRDKSMLNIYYIRNYSLLLDLKILVRTVKVVLSGEGNI